MATIAIPVIEHRPTGATSKDKQYSGVVLVSDKAAKAFNYTTTGVSSEQVAIISDKKSHERVFGDNKKAQVAESKILQSLGAGQKRRGGGQRVVFYTNKLTKPNSSTHKQISINVPAWMSRLDISVFVALTFVNAKWGYGANEIKPFFRVEKGNIFPIVKKEVAEALQKDAVETDPGKIIQEGQSSGKEFVKAIAGD